MISQPERWRQLRLAAASLLTCTALAWGYALTVMEWLVDGHVRFRLVAWTVLAAVLVAGLVWRLSSAKERGTRAWLGITIGGWVAAAALFVQGFIAISHHPWVAVGVLAGSGALWPALAWWPQWRHSRRSGLVVVAGGVLLQIILPRLWHAENVRGDGRIPITWRWETPRLQVPPAATSPDERVDQPAARLAEFSQFLGPWRNAVLAAPRLDRDWRKNPPRRLWSRGVGAGWGGITVAGDRAITQEQHGTEERVVGYDALSGKLVWTHTDATRFDGHATGPGPRATPTIVDNQVFSLGATGILNCLSLTDGARRWHRDLVADAKGAVPEYGCSSSPLVVEDRVYVAPASGHFCLAAYRAADGTHLWTRGDHAAAYASPLLAQFDGVTMIVVNHADGLAAFDPQTGETLWDAPLYPRSYHCSQPIVPSGAEGLVYGSVGDGGGSALFRVRRNSRQPWLVETVWTSHRMRTKFTTAVLYDGYLYGLDDGVLACQELATGKLAWKQGRYAHGQLLLVADLLVIVSEAGELALVPADPAGWQELGRLPVLSGQTWNCPALAGDVLYVRNAESAAAWQLPLSDE